MSVIARAVAVLLLSVFAIQALAATQAEIDQSRSKGIAWLYNSQKGDGSWKTSGGLQIQPTAVALEALLNAGVTRGRPFATAQSWLANADSLSTDSLSRQSIALYKSGANVTTLMTRLVTMRSVTTKSWGAYSLYAGSFPDTSLALDAITITNTTYADTSASLGFISARQNPDGGWSFTTLYGEPGTSVSRVIPTTHNIATLSRYKAIDSGVDTNITNAVNWLVARQKADGGFVDDLNATVGTPYETALACIALNEGKKAGNAAAIAVQTALDNAQNFLIAQQQTDGSWSGDPLMTALALQILPATTLADSDNDGIPDVVENILSTNASLPDGRTLNRSNGDSVTGITASVLLSTIPVNRSFNMTLTVSGGTAPYTWGLVSGSLPTGLSLGSSTGTISGTPTATGSFNFYYQVSDNSGLSATTPSQISVEPLPVMVRLPAISYFDTLQSAYAAQPDGGSVTIQTKDVTLNEDLSFDREIAVLLSGGYDDIFTSRTGVTALTGTLTIIGGSVTVDGIIIE
ncbi:MAG: prenyltransferase/squalene oxidase repeat-containing protein [Desulfobulbaceae bacterium]|nr:prenyltransferase/squalene oxidase repeat-containing protein [Desulfobulbaceae bacterium]